MRKTSIVQPRSDIAYRQGLGRAWLSILANGPWQHKLELRLMKDFAGAERQVSRRWARFDLDLPPHSPHGLKRVLSAVHR